MFELTMKPDEKLQIGILLSLRKEKLLYLIIYGWKCRKWLFHSIACLFSFS